VPLGDLEVGEGKRNAVVRHVDDDDGEGILERIEVVDDGDSVVIRVDDGYRRTRVACHVILESRIITWK
jgi:hypothetical protein